MEMIVTLAPFRNREVLSPGWVRLGLLLMLFSATASCTTTLTRPAAEVVAAPPTEVSTKLSVGDTVNIKFRFWPELDDTQAIRPDGKITLQLVGDVYVAGLSPEEIQARLIQCYASKIKEPDIIVIVRGLANQRVFVGGEVKNPGVVPMPGRMTVLEAILAAGGFEKRSAELSNVVVVRHTGDRLLATAVDLNKALREPEQEPFYLAAQDVIYVPRTKIDALNQWVDQYINRLIPSSSLNVSYKVDADTTVGVTGVSHY